jgi:rRNA maturation endonuclease Nob1
MSKINVMDTSFLMQYPDYVKSKKKTEDVFIIPDVVIRELDLLKNAPDREKAGRARRASRVILEAQNKGKAVVIDKYSGNTNALSSKTDNRVIDAALELKRRGYDVVLHTTDVLMGVVAGSHGITVKTSGIEGENRGKLPLSAYIQPIVVSLIMSLFIGLLFDSIIAGILASTILLLMTWPRLTRKSTSSDSYSTWEFHSDDWDAHNDDWDAYNDERTNPCLAFMPGNIYHSSWLREHARRWE